jgi:urease accessory protein
MRRAWKILRGGGALADSGSVTLDYEGRYRRRITLETDAGETILLDVAEATLIADGDALELEGGGTVAVRAAPEALLRIEGEGAAHLMRLAWHIGNRHLPAMIGTDCLFIRYDHVIADMLRGLGARVSQVDASFSPEGGAYAARAPDDGHGHHHGHPHGHRHD